MCRLVSWVIMLCCIRVFSCVVLEVCLWVLFIVCVVLVWCN